MLQAWYPRWLKRKGRIAQADQITMRHAALLFRECLPREDVTELLVRAFLHYSISIVGALLELGIEEQEQLSLITARTCSLAPFATTEAYERRQSYYKRTTPIPRGLLLKGADQTFIRYLLYLLSSPRTFPNVNQHHHALKYGLYSYLRQSSTVSSECHCPGSQPHPGRQQRMQKDSQLADFRKDTSARCSQQPIVHNNRMSPTGEAMALLKEKSSIGRALILR
ncbi:hypothetical protein BU26DRAFT_243439 [Trematosphaeria pertusa]|uniref:Uncharacterized protein n=1 Tax=Trematosphaeria pertusa TaxID=390896 RepID=A0A6A6IQI4_9PLEO|nr:uncharacterized protein BU26DRAFT_243439 [Trematosphaeria pertusa]KAF2251773.1 hypothetical protein BU26DRAFT_243439 [Trematosphaeria pertusa]